MLHYRGSGQRKYLNNEDTKTIMSGIRTKDADTYGLRSRIRKIETTDYWVDKYISFRKLKARTLIDLTNKYNTLNPTDQISLRSTREHVITYSKEL